MPVVRIPVNLTWPASGSPGVNVFHLRTTDAWGTPGFDLIVGEGLDALHTFYGNWASVLAVPGFTWSVGEGVTDVETQEAKDYTVRSGNVSGTAGAAPQALAIVVGWRTTLAARRGRGRTFLGPLRSDIIQSDGSIAETPLNTLRTQVDMFVAESTGIAGGAFAVYGQESAGIGSAHVARDIIDARVRDVFAVLRSRRD